MKLLNPRPSTLALSTRQRSTAPGRMNIVVGEKFPFTAVGGATRACPRRGPASASTENTSTRWISISRSR